MSQTVASHPARVRIEFGRFLKCDGKDLIVLAITLVLAAVIAPFKWQFALVLLGIGVFVVLSSLQTARQLFLEGDVCPAIVVDPEQQLIAVSTNLSQSGGRKQVLKVLKLPLNRTVLGEVKKGQRLGYVALYSGRPGAQTWTNFGGYLLDAGTSNRKKVQQVVAAISDQEWQRLVGAVRQLEKPYTTGFYDIGAVGLDGAGLKLRPSPLRVRPGLAVAGGGALMLVVGLVVLGMMSKVAPQGGGNAPPANPPILANADPADENVVPQDQPVAPGPGEMFPGQFGLPGARPGGPPPEWVQDQQRPFDEHQRRRAAAIQDQNRTNGASPDTTTPPPGQVGNPFQSKSPTLDSPMSSAGENPFQSKESMGSAGWLVGQKAEANWNNSWLPVTILKINSDGTIRIHWEGYSDSWDEDVAEAKLRRPQK